jgi:hypothetical protein
MDMASAKKPWAKPMIRTIDLSPKQIAVSFADYHLTKREGQGCHEGGRIAA